jgi:salicylate hydroxylase
MKIGILGSGIGGLAAAISLQKLMPGVTYTILEQAPEVKEVGAGIGLGDNGVQILQKLGLFSQLQEVGNPITRSQIRNQHNHQIKTCQ